MDIYSLIGGLGLGSILTLLIKEYLNNKKTMSQRAFEEKKEAYIAYLNIALRSQTMPEKQAIWERTAAMERIKLCGNKIVIDFLDNLSKSHPNDYRSNLDKLIQEMRKDLWNKNMQ